MKIGVLAFDQNYFQQMEAVSNCGHESVILMCEQDVTKIQGLIICGENPRNGNNNVSPELLIAIKKQAAIKLPIFSISEGTLLLAKEVIGQSMSTLKIMDIKVEKYENDESNIKYEADLDIPVLGKKFFKATFTSSLKIIEAKPNLGILAIYKDTIVLVRQGNFLACTFRPELTCDLRIHQYFIRMVEDSLI